VRQNVKDEDMSSSAMQMQEIIEIICDGTFFYDLNLVMR
jgi:hypothetical protein